MTSLEQNETPRGHRVQANGPDIYYEEHGRSQGQALLLLHGGALTGES